MRKKSDQQPGTGPADAGQHDDAPLRLRQRDGVYIIGDPRAPVATARPVPLVRIQSYILRRALRAWGKICALDQAYERGDGPGYAFYGHPDLFTPRSSLLRVTSGNPLNWVYLYFGEDLCELTGSRNLEACFLRDFAFTDIARVSAQSFTDVTLSLKPAAHYIDGIADGYRVNYVRIAFPVLGRRGNLLEVLTISDEVIRTPI